MQSTLHYNFPLYEGEDTPNLLVEWNSTMQALDTKLYALSIGNAGPEIIREIEQLITAVNNLITEVTEAISDIDDLQSTVNGLQSNINQIFTNIDGVQDTVVALQGVVQTLQTTVSGYSGDISNLQNSVSTLTSSMATLNGALENMQTSISSIDGRVTALEQAPSYELPTASANTLGGVKVGENLSIDANGVLSASGGSSYTLPVASSNTLGGIKVGSGLSIENDGTLSTTGGSGGGGTVVLPKVVNYNYDLDDVATALGTEYTEDDYDVPINFRVIGDSVSKILTLSSTLPITVTNFTLNKASTISIKFKYNLSNSTDVENAVKYAIKESENDLGCSTPMFRRIYLEHMPGVIIGSFEIGFENDELIGRYLLDTSFEDIASQGTVFVQIPQFEIRYYCPNLVSSISENILIEDVEIMVFNKPV